MNARWPRRILLALGGLVLLVLLAGELLEDRRVRMTTLVTMDPPPGPIAHRLDGHGLSIVGASVKAAAATGLELRAWAPTPTIRVTEVAGPGSVTVVLENMPLGARLDASGPVEERRDGLIRRLRFAPQGTRRLAFDVPGRDLTFAVLGDTGDSPTFRTALRLAARDHAEFLLLPGDLIYEDAQIPNIEQIFERSPLPIYVARGNHDYRNARRIAFMRRLGPPYYSFRVAGITFIVLDNAGRYVPTLWRRSTQYAWLTGALGVPRDGPLFVMMHKQPFDRRTEYARRAPMEDPPFVRQLMQDFLTAGVDAVFTGHAHASHIWVQDGIPYVIAGEGFETRDGVDAHRMAWVRVRGWDVSVAHRPIWRPD